MAEASTSRGANRSRPQLFLPSSESLPGPQPFSFAKNRPSFSVSAFGSPLPVSIQVKFHILTDFLRLGI